MNPYLFIILCILIFHYLVDLVTDLLNISHVSDVLPEEFQGFYDGEKYGASQKYLRDTTRFGLLENTIHLVVMAALILTGAFDLLDRSARFFGTGPIGTGLIFFGIFALASKILGLPFSIYETFAIEEKYGFNRTTPRTFVTDVLKGLALSAVIGGPLLAAVLWLFETAGPGAWLICWGTVVVVQVFLLFIGPYVIMPLFNKFVPLEAGELKTAIETLAEAQGFRMKGVFKMDASKRSSKSNAFFTGFGKSRRIVLFDTLIEKHSVDELVAVLAHEIGHYKNRHIMKAIGRSVIMTAVIFFLMSRFIRNPALFDAFGVKAVSVYASLLFFGFLYTPLAMMTSVIENAISRRHEYEADAFAVAATGHADALVSGLKKLSVDNLSNLTPHPLKVLLGYSHPPILERIKAIRGKG